MQFTPTKLVSFADLVTFPVVFENINFPTFFLFQDLISKSDSKTKQEVFQRPLKFKISPNSEIYKI